MYIDNFYVDNNVDEITYYIYAPESFSYISPDNDEDNTFTHFHFAVKHHYLTSLIINNTYTNHITDEFESFVDVVVEELLQSKFNYTLQQLQTATEEYLNKNNILFTEMQPIFKSYDTIHIRKLGKVIEGIYYEDNFKHKIDLTNLQ